MTGCSLVTEVLNIVNFNPRTTEEPLLGPRANKLTLSWTFVHFMSPISLYVDLTKSGIEDPLEQRSCGGTVKEKQLSNKQGNRKEKRERNGKGRGGLEQCVFFACF